MSLPTKDIQAGAVPSISDTDLVMVAAPSGGYQPISAANFVSSLKKNAGVNLISKFPSPVVANNWLRVASFTNKHSSVGTTAFYGSLSVMFSYSSSVVPKPAFIIFGGYPATWGQLQATLLNKEACVSAIRFVQDGDQFYIDIKMNHDKANSITAILTHNFCVNLIQASLVEDSPANVLKTIEFSGGGIINYQSASYVNLEDLLGRKGGAHDAYEGDNGCVQECADGYLVFGTLDSLCQFIGRSSEAYYADYPSYTLSDSGRLGGSGRGDNPWDILDGGCDNNEQTACSDWLECEPCGSLQTRVVYHTTADECSRSCSRESEIQHSLGSLQDLPVHHGIADRKEVAIWS